MRDCLEKDPSDRTEEDIEILMEFTHTLEAFAGMTQVQLTEPRASEPSILKLK